MQKRLRLAVALFLLVDGALSICPTRYNAKYFEYVIANSGNHFPMCVYLYVGGCTTAAVSSLSSVISGENGITSNYSATGLGANIACATGGTCAGQPFMSHARHPWKLAENFPGTFFVNTASYAIFANGVYSGYYWDGPLLGGSGKLIASAQGSIPFANGVSSGTTDTIFMCTSAYASSLNAATATKGQVQP